MDTKNIVFFNKFLSDKKDKRYESLENSISDFLKTNMPSPGIVNKIYLNWKNIIYKIKNDEELSLYVSENSYPYYITKRRNGEIILTIIAKNSSVSSFFKNNRDLLINIINMEFKRVVINKIKVSLF